MCRGSMRGTLNALRSMNWWNWCQRRRARRQLRRRSQSKSNFPTNELHDRIYLPAELNFHSRAFIVNYEMKNNLVLSERPPVYKGAHPGFQWNYLAIGRHEPREINPA